ncbi:hybrid sensor histidine kinase/response regulator transcription factor [Flexithrix dorotheae]|uniref:hybrid sensor histidine kinase/response regulator transcription factor n=1 Tax=Flexithrix dorotheae TaxID=70993 RepID=UPI0003716A16|nr:two-component regulator propeller domain-containing protein [Flexithrix dorotheae]
MNWCLTTCLFFLTNTLLFSQNGSDIFFKFSHLSGKNGLPHNSILAIHQDHQGFIWFGTDDGLCRYDGYSFVVYRHNPEDPESISSNVIRAIDSDTKGNLWIGTSGGGLNRYDPLTDSFTSFTQNLHQNKSISHNKVFSVCVDHHDNVWAGTLGEGLNKLIIDPETQKVVKIKHFKHESGNSLSISDNEVWTIYEDKQQTLWIGTYDGGLQYFNRQNQTFIKFHLPKINGHEIKSVKTILQDSQNKLWIGTEHFGLFQFDLNEKSFRHFQQNGEERLSFNNISSILEDKQGNLWVGTLGGGLNLFDQKKQEFINFKDTPNRPYSLKGLSVFSLFEDKSGILWVGMYSGEGLNKLDPRVQQFKHFYQIPGDYSSLQGKLVKSILMDRDGQLWVGTFGGGLNLYNKNNGTFTHFLHDPKNTQSLSHNNVQCIFEDKAGNIWIGTDGGGLNRFNRKNKTFSHFRHNPKDPDSIGDDEVWTITEDSKGNLWIGFANGGGVSQYNPSKNQFINFTNNPNDHKSLSFNDVRVVVEDRSGIIWIGTYGGGLNKFNFKTNNFQIFRNKPGDNTSLSNDVITSFLHDKRGNYWIGTFGGGLNLFDPDKNTFKVYREKNGLPSDVIKAMVEDENGFIWISTVKGLSRFDPQKESFKNFTVNDGLQSDEFNLGSVFKDTNGLLYFGGTNGFNVFNPELVLKSQPSPRLVLTNLRVLNKSVKPGQFLNDQLILNKSIWGIQEVVLNNKNNVFLLEFAALEFSSPEKIQYAYKLEGEDDHWINTSSTRRFAPYSNLSPGNYNFQLAATNFQGNQISPTLSLKLVVLPPWWRTNWAYFSYFFILVGLSILGKQIISTRIKLRHDLKITKLEKEKSEELNQMKLTFFTNISHELRTPLTLILVPLEKLMVREDLNQSVQNQLKTIYRNVERLLRLINQILDFRKQETGNLKLQIGEENLETFIKKIKSSFNSLANQRNITFDFLTDQQNIKVWIDSEQMEKVMYNLISNAFKFTKDNGKISIRIATNFDLQETYIEVTDNGKGILDEHLEHIFDRYFQNERSEGKYFAGSGIGLALAKNLVELHQGRIEVKSIPNNETVFKVILKNGKEHFGPLDFADNEKILTDGVEHHIQSDLGQSNFEKDIEIIDNKGTDTTTKPTLLFIEDNPEVLALLEKSFNGFYKVTTAPNGIEGLKIAKNLLPDLVISDVMMPGMDGTEVCHHLKTEMKTSHIPVILLTAKDSFQFKLEGLEAGADDYITKPFHLKILDLKVKNLLESRRKLRDKFSKQLHLEPSEIALTPLDEQLIAKAIKVVEQYIDSSELDVALLGKELGLSRSLLFTKLKGITGQTPNEFVQIIRLKRAAQILSQQKLKISEVCYMVGFNQPKYFTKKFKQLFGVSPSEFSDKSSNNS